MNPDDFSWTEEQSVTVTNPTSQPFKFMVHSKEYEVGAGQTAKMPGYIAWMYVYGLASQLSQADGNWSRWNEEGFRQEYYGKVVVGADAVVQTIEVEPAPLVQTFDDEEEAEDAAPVPGTGQSYEPKATRGRPAKA